MDFNKTKIEDLRTAEAFYKSLFGNSYWMASEYDDRGAEYNALGITDKQEREWAVEANRELQDNVVSDPTNTEAIVNSLSDMRRWIASLKDGIGYQFYADALRYIDENSSDYDAVILADASESLLGKDDEGGYVNAGRALEQFRIAKLLHDLGYSLAASGAKRDGPDGERCRNVLKRKYRFYAGQVGCGCLILPFMLIYWMLHPIQSVRRHLMRLE